MESRPAYGEQVSGSSIVLDASRLQTKAMHPNRPLSRRSFLGASAVGSAVALLPGAPSSAAPSSVAPSFAVVPPADYKIQNGRIRHSVMGWCFNPMPTEQLIDACHKM